MYDIMIAIESYYRETGLRLIKGFESWDDITGDDGWQSSIC